ncbi:hypothetical protein ACET3Z_014553 [Daucus carota]
MACNNTIQHTNVAANVNGPNLNALVPPEEPSRHLNTRLEQLYQFNFELPEGYVPDLTDEVSKLVSLGHKDWLPLAERLEGWTREVRVRINNAHRDHFYYHGDKKFRTYQDVKRYIYLGYPPKEENADEPLERWALNQPEPKLVKIYGPRYPAARNTDSQAGPSTRSLVGDHSAGGSSSSRQ